MHESEDVLFEAPSRAAGGDLILNGDGLPRSLPADGWHAPRTLAEVPGGQGTIKVHSWAPDGTRIAYVEYPAGTD